MNRVTYPPASGSPSGTTGQPCPALTGDAVARAWFFPGKACFRSLAFLSALAAVFGPERAVAAGSQLIKGHVPAVVQRMNLQTTGELPATNRLNLAIGLPLRNGRDLTNFLEQLYDPASPNYRKFITPSQFSERFGPSQKDYNKLKDFLTAQGVTVTATHPNRVLLDVNLSVADIQRVFHIRIRTYEHPAEHRAFYAPDAEPSIDLDVPLLHVSGLDNYQMPRPLFHPEAPRGPAATNGPLTGSGPGGSYFGSDFRTAYVPGVSWDGAGQSLALVEFDNYFPSDISDYETLAGLNPVPLVNVPVDGFTNAPTAAGDPEVSLDIEMAVAMAPGLSQILVYEEINSTNAAFPANDILNKIATIYQQYATQGQSFFQASGDNGSFNWSATNQERTDNPYVTLVGGTTLTTTNGGAWLSEKVWNWNYTGGGGTNDASGGGISTNYTIPTWQRGINMGTNKGSTTFRNVPDVALTADNVYVTYMSGQADSFGGTSCAAPLWAAFCALVNEKAQATGSAAMGFINPAIYGIGKGALYTNSFHDITNGNNTNIDDPTQFFAVPGYDLCTGWGTPVGAALINALVPSNILTADLLLVSATLSGGNGNGVIDPNECNNLSVQVENAGDATATGVQGTLSSLTAGVVIGQSVSPFTNIPPGGIAVNQRLYTISTVPSFVCGTTVILQLVLNYNQLATTNLIEFATGGTVGPPVRFDNSTPMTLSANNGYEVISPITVSNINSIGKVTVSVYLTTPVDEYMELELVSPDGSTYSLLAELDGGTGANFGSACSPDSRRTTFDDAATNAIYLGVAPLAGSYSPETPLSAFNQLSGASANGTWELYAINLYGTTAATLQCWSLFISPEQCTDGGGQCPGSVLSVTMNASPITTPTFTPVTYTLTVSNAGPSPAPDTVVNQTLPSGIIYQGSVSSQGTVSQTGSLLTFSLGTLGIYSNATITVTAEAVQAGLWTSTAIVGATNANPDPVSNTASASVLVTKPYADLALTLSAGSASLPVNGQEILSITVTNNGPATALGVTVTNSIPANVKVVAVGASQGSVSPAGTLVSFGTLLPGSGATATLVVSPTIVGTCTVSSRAGLDRSEIDPVLNNNSASVSFTALPAADLGVSVIVSPNPGISGQNLSYLVTVTNSGPATATNVFLNQTLPAGATYVTNSQTNVIVSGGLVTWTINTMPSGTSQTMTTTVQAPTLIQGVLSNVLVSTFNVAGQPGDPNTNNNFVSVSTVVLRPTVIIAPLGDTLTWESLQPPNGAVAPGETVAVAFQLENIGNIPSTNLVATLQTNGWVIPMQTNAGGIPIPGQSSANYGAMAPGGGVATGQFLFSNNATDGGTGIATLQLQDGATSYGTVSFTFVMPVVSTFWNASVISVPATNYVATNQAMGPAGPFPSGNWVSGISNYVSGVTITVSNLEHSYPSDISLWVVGPGGQSTMLMSGAASQSSASIPVTITFDQSASSIVPEFGSLYTGSYQPADYSPPVLPPGLNNIVPPGNTNLSVFQGISPNGWWHLYAYDSKAGDYGTISNGWAVAVTTITPVNQITDIGVTVAASANQVVLGSNVTYMVTVTNLGTNAATVFLTNVLGAGLSFLSNTIPPYAPYLFTNLTPSNQAQIYNLGSLAGQTNLTLGFVATATATNSQTNTVVYVGSTLIDPNTNNNQAIASVTVVLPAADVSAAISSSAIAGSVIVGSNVIYTLVVTNNGPGLAYNVVGLLTQGLAGPPTLVLSNYFGDIVLGAGASVSFTNAPILTGALTNIWTVSTGSTDANAGNNTATNLLTVNYPEPVIVANGAELLSGNSLQPNGGIDPNETVTVAFTLANIGVAPTTNLTAALQSGNGVIPVAVSQNYGTIRPGASAAQIFSFTASAASGSTITAVLSLTNNGAFWGTVSFPFVLSTTVNFANTGMITIPNDSPASPYPSVIAVSTTNKGLIGNVTVTLQGFTHTFPHDVNVLLASPSGQRTVLMAHVGGPYSVTNLVLAFSGAATNSLTAGMLVSGTYLPAQLAPLDSFPAIYGQPSNTDLSVFNGGNPNGNWSLYVYDDAAGNGGYIANGWTLNLSIINPVNSPGSLAVGMTHAPDPVFTNNILTFGITVTNLGPYGATNVLLTDTLPANASLISAASSQGTVNTNVTGIAAFNFGVLASPGATATATLKVQPFLAGLAVNTAAATDAAGSSATASNTVSVASAALPTVQAIYNDRILTLTLNGQPGQSYILQVSTNLVSWSGISTNTANAQGQFTFTNNVTNAPERFFRALHLPQ
jgi:uncharacterized repeat protein (TIGR01451 family)